ncbi:hypothetical protein GGS23DRAFT_619711 [Durotheca rogersii]|uniref:uncharacterized protein n=1 Tax=Durotheca rogersii TaxID=419775 RepID=UPI00221EF691|nr:uncharacterized protein GGS23DRAFT_619711 [Durotheca rogersii]KAI5854998.1 hypothetical protein GGS23DRAFT_619711 [Durotheca rogersii]
MADNYMFGNTQLDIVHRGGYRGRANGEAQHTDVFDDECRKLLLQGRIDRIVHGEEREGGKPATLVVFGFRFHGINRNRRFREAIITILFQDEKKRDGADPAPIALWPNGNYTLGHKTEIDRETTNTIETCARAGAVGGPVGAEIDALWKWERKEGHKTTCRASMTGSIILDTAVRQSGDNNAIRLAITENEKERSGLVTDLRVAVLLERKNDTDRFTASIRVNARADLLYNAIHRMRALLGRAPPNDAVIFQPGLPPYLRPPTLTPSMEAKLAVHVDAANLNPETLNELGSAVATTVLTTTVTE